jgi:glycyl-tRNA synthetase beta chain
MSAPLLIELGCEEIPARMIPGAASDLASRLVDILDKAAVGHGAATAWGGSRRLAVRIEEVAGGQEDRIEEFLGPPASVALDDAGKPTPAAVGFAKKQGVAPDALEIFETPKGRYVGLRREVRGRKVGEILRERVPRAVEAMSFPKTMRWGDGSFRWVRPLHWVLAIHGEEPLELELMGVRAGSASEGHRFLSPGPVPVAHPDCYGEALRGAHVIVDPAERRKLLLEMLTSAASSAGGELVEDPGLLNEVADLVEWPGVVAGSFDARYLELPREVLITTLRHHQKCFSVQSQGELQPVFLALANTDRDPGGHIRRGNQWVVSGRLEDARFFWHEDRCRPLADRLPELDGVVFHEGTGSYGAKSRRTADLVRGIADRVGSAAKDPAAEAASLAKADLLTDLVGEFPELQGVVGGLLLRAEGADPAVASGVYEHYLPSGPDDPVPETESGRLVSLADKLDSVAQLIRAGAKASGSKDPFALRRAGNGIFRIVLDSGWDLSVREISGLAGGDEMLETFLRDRLDHFLRERGYTSNETRSVFRAKQGGEGLPIPDALRRLDAVRGVRARDDFAQLVDLTNRTSNILPQVSQLLESELRHPARPERYESFRDPKPAGLELSEMIERLRPVVDELAAAKRYDEVIESLAGFLGPVARFFDDVLVMDEQDLDATYHRCEMLARLQDVLTRYFDLRQLPGEAERSER